MVMTRSTRKKRAAAMKEVVVNTMDTTSEGNISPSAINCACFTKDKKHQSNGMEDVFVKRGFPMPTQLLRYDDDDALWESLSIPNVESTSTSSPFSTSDGSSFSNCHERSSSSRDQLVQVGDVYTGCNENEKSASSTAMTETKQGVFQQPRNTAAQVSKANEWVSEVNTEMMALVSKQESSDMIVETSDDEDDQGSDAYVSKEELLLLLPPESYEEYEYMVEEETNQRQADRVLRRQLIRQELGTLLRLMKANDFLEIELEREAEDALQVAANHVCYLKKYYDVAKCEYIFVPSVAYAVMDGTLLEEASKYYHGNSKEFVVSYAPSLRATVLSQKNYQDDWNVEKSEMELADDIDVSETTLTRDQRRRNESVSDLFLGVSSPKNVSSNEAVTDARLQSETESPSNGLLNKKMKKRLRLAAGLYCILAPAVYGIMLVLQPQVDLSDNLEVDKIDWPTEPRLDIISPHEHLSANEPLQLAPQVADEIPTKSNDHADLITALSTLVTSDSSFLPVSEIQSEPDSVKPSPKRPIAANLLYYH